ncbi:hypothetical protein KW797_02330 [Candidatus Parcubacteria bacterium]|nr:hypothetical protein [Candidatus Parcubacteria bacterium]
MNDERPETKNLPGFPVCNRPDLILRFLATGATEKQFEKLAGLHDRFISRAKLGAHASVKSQNNWRKFEAALALCEKAKANGEGLPAPKGPKKVSRIASEAPGALPGDLSKAITEARGEEQFGSIIAEITVRSLLPEEDPRHIPATQARVAKELLGEARQTRKQQREEEAKARGGDVVTVEIRYVNAEWRKGEAN